jgi:hypothetical protein
MKLSVDFFVKFDELGEVPQVKRVLINDVPVCLSGGTTLSSGSASNSEEAFGSSQPTKPSGISLLDLPLQRFPSVTQIPYEVNNVSYAKTMEN